MTIRCLIFVAFMMCCSVSFQGNVTAVRGESMQGTAKMLFVEAESFRDHGGWVLDQQFMDQMGSPILMAHGIGDPVADAITEITFPGPGDYHVFVRTRNWVAPWTTEHAPGRFQLLLDGKPLDTIYGTTGNSWHWQKGDIVKVDGRKKTLTLSLHDLTGFNGRVDAIFFSENSDFIPPDDATSLIPIRRRALNLPDTPPDAKDGPFDLVVIGGGYAGICTAVTAARLDLKVALIQDRPYIGGNASPEVAVRLAGNICLPPYPNLGNQVYELKHAEPVEYEVNGRKYSQGEMQIVLAEKNIHLFLSTHAVRVELEANRIKAVIGQNIETGKELRFAGKLFADCTGDGSIGFLAGADFRMGREPRRETGEPMAPEVADKLTMGTTLIWQTQEESGSVSFPELPWAFQFTPESILPDLGASWNWETGLDRDQVEEAERIRDHGFMAIFGHWAYLKNNEDPRWTSKIHNKKLVRVPYVAGKRESRRLVGDVVLREQDFRESKPYPDALVTCTWPIDLHYANDYSKKHFPGEEFRTYCTHDRYPPYPIPYRCLYSRNIPNLFMAGRNISVTHVALGPVRVMQTCGMMGEVVGRAASVCVENNALPRDVYEKYLDDLKRLCEKPIAPVPPEHEFPLPWVKNAGASLAATAKVTVSSTVNAQRFGAKFINDNIIEAQVQSRRWVSREDDPHWIVFEFSKPETINAYQLVSGQPRPKLPLLDFVLQYEKDGDWIDIEETRKADNVRTYAGAVFNPVTAKRFRLWIGKTTDGIARVWEVGLFRFDPKVER